MDDLDSLLEDLGRGRTPAKPAQNSNRNTVRPISTKVDLNELESLMSDLAAPTPKQKPTPVPVTAVMNASQTSNNSTNYPEPVSQSVVQEPVVESSKAESNVDDLESLMESLNMVSNNRSNRRQPRASEAKTSPQVKTSPTISAKSQNPVAPPVAPVTHSAPTYVPPVSVPQSNIPQSNIPQSNIPQSKPYQTGGGPAKGDDLDGLLSNLTSQMNSIDAENPASRGTCFTCKGAILGEIIQALGRSYHPEHFSCGNCRDPLGTKNFFEQNNVPYCQNCYQLLFCAKCAYCEQSILDRCITALGKKWHPEHFICTQCLKPFPDGNFFEKEGRVYCEDDFFSLFAPKCGACTQPIKGDCINALSQQWHPEHFVCTYCSKPFTGAFFEVNGKPYCEAHYFQQTGSLCGGCGNPITGRCVNALNKKWHPEHFVCAFCMNPLAGGAFSEKNNKAYCKECFGKLFSG